MHARRMQTSKLYPRRIVWILRGSLSDWTKTQLTQCEWHAVTISKRIVALSLGTPCYTPVNWKQVEGLQTRVRCSLTPTPAPTTRRAARFWIFCKRWIWAPDRPYRRALHMSSLELINAWTIRSVAFATIEITCVETGVEEGLPVVTLWPFGLLSPWNNAEFKVSFRHDNSFRSEDPV